MIYAIAKVANGILYKECKNWDDLMKLLENWSNTETIDEIHITKLLDEDLKI